MIPAIRSEFRKIFTIRSTYVVIAFCIALLGLFSFYIGGYKIADSSLANRDYINNQITLGVAFVGIVLSFIAIFSVTHEYRYNTILYTLTSARSRLQTIFSKFVAISVVAIILSTLFAVLAMLFVNLGLQVAGKELATQNLELIDHIGRAVFGGWGYAMLAFILALLIRSQVGTIAAVFLIPSTIETIAGLLLKDNAQYLPYTALVSVLQPTDLSYGTAAIVTGIYVVGGLAVAAVLFVKRDAN